MSSDFVSVWKVLIMSCFTVLSWYLLGGTEENQSLPKYLYTVRFRQAMHEEK